MKRFSTPVWVIIGFSALILAFWMLLLGSGVIGRDTAKKPPVDPYFVEIPE